MLSSSLYSIARASEGGVGVSSILATEIETDRAKMADNSSPAPSSEQEKPAPESSDSSAADLQKRISDAFDIFDHESNKTVDVR